MSHLFMRRKFLISQCLTKTVNKFFQQQATLQLFQIEGHSMFFWVFCFVLFFLRVNEFIRVFLRTETWVRGLHKGMEVLLGSRLGQ